MNIEGFIEARKVAGLSQQELSEGICTQATLSKFENNGQVPSLKILIKLCNRINLPLVTLFSSMNVEMTKINEELERAEFFLITSEFDQLTTLLQRLEKEKLDDPTMFYRYCYIKGFEMINIGTPIHDVLFQFDQILLQEPTDKIYHLLAYTGVGMVYAREKEWKKAEFYINKVFEKIYDYPIRSTEDTWRILTIVYHCGAFYADINEIETSNSLLNYVIAICSDNHITYYLARAAAKKAENAITLKAPKDVILEMLREAKAYAKFNRNVKLLEKLDRQILQLNESKGSELV